MNVRIKRLERGDLADFRQLIEIFQEVFDRNDTIAAGEALERLLANRDFEVFVVTSEVGVVGGLTMYVLHPYLGNKPVAYLYDVGIATDYQRKGLGKQLIGEVCNWCRENGFESAYVEAEAEDLDAVSFYRRTDPGSELKAIHFTYGF